jgi:hypothetical protein
LKNLLNCKPSLSISWWLSKMALEKSYEAKIQAKRLKILISKVKKGE